MSGADRPPLALDAYDGDWIKGSRKIVGHRATLSRMGYSLVTAVSFERTPVPEIGTKWMELHALGWEWQENSPPRWIAHFKREYPDAESAKGAEDEVARVMGDYYVSAGELEAGAADESQPLTP